MNVLREVAAYACITQAELARRCSLSVAMVNNYMKDLCNNDFLEYKRKSIKSVTYHLTPSGEQYLAQLQTELISEMAQMFTNAKEQIRNKIMEQAKSSLNRVVLYGTGNLAQITFHALELSGIRVLSVCDDNPFQTGSDFCGREVVASSQIRFLAPDAVVIADITKVEEIFRNLYPLTQRGIELIRLDNKSAIPSSAQPATDTATIFSVI